MEVFQYFRNWYDPGVTSAESLSLSVSVSHTPTHRCLVTPGFICIQNREGARQTALEHRCLRLDAKCFIDLIETSTQPLGNF